MQTKAVHYEDEEIIVDLVVSSATVLIGAKKFRLQEASEDAIKAADTAGLPLDPDFRIVALGVYPSMLAPTIEWKATRKDSGEAILLPTLESFVGLPEALWDVWNTAVYALNPHWVPKAPEGSKKAKVQEEENLKKAESSLSESTSP